MTKELFPSIDGFLLASLLNLPDCVMYGSRALGVHTNTSDYDIAVPYSSIKHLDERYYLPVVDPRVYFSHYPANYSEFTRLQDKDGVVLVDILVLSSKQDLHTVKKVMKIMKRIPKFILKRKSIRVYIYSRLLWLHGWKKR